MPSAAGIRVLPGPRPDWFTDPAELFGQPWTVQPESNRIGIRLAGTPLRRSRSGELPPEPMLPGAVQVPPSGQPIILFRDAPGDRRLSGDRRAARPPSWTGSAQLRPGDVVRFRPA